MYTDRFFVVQDRTLREQDLVERIAERNRYARSGRGLSLPARVARRLFALAVATEREKMEARGRL